MEYGCRVRTLIRTVGIAAGLTLAASVYADDTVSSRAAENARPLSHEDTGVELRQGIRRFQGGSAPEGFVAPAGDRIANCTLNDATQCYSRPAAFAPITTAIIGEFNADRFHHYDEFVASANGNVTSLCWSANFSDDLVCGLIQDPMEPADDEGFWTINYFSTIAGFPGVVIGGPFTNTTPGVTVDYNVNPVADIGFNNPDVYEHIWVMTHPAVAVSANTCYWVRFDWNQDAAADCFMNLILSYENQLGNRRSLRLDVTDMQPPANKDFINEDIAMCVGIVDGAMMPVNLANSNNINGMACTTFVSPVSNDDINGAVSILCDGQITGADNRYATFNNLFDEAGCAILGLDPMASSFLSGDFWFSFVATDTSARVATCATQGEVGIAAGDSIIQVFRVLPGATAPFDPSEVEAIACSDNACGAYSEANVLGLNVNETYYIRIHSKTGAAQGLHNITLECPVPQAVNAECSTATTVPASGMNGGWTDPAGTIFESSTRDGILNTDPGACINPTFPTDTPTLSNTSRGIWYKLTGIGPNGFRVDISTDNALQNPGTIFDTRITVYCSPTEMCDDLACLNADDDIDVNANNFRSRLDFCALDGKTYYIYIHGFGSEVGEFAASFRRVVNMGVPVECCDDQSCVNTQVYSIPPGAVAELEPCDNFTVPPDFTSPTNDGCNIPGSNPLVAMNPNGAGTRQGLYEEGGAIGNTIFGSMRSFNQYRDNDWLIYRGLPINNERYIWDSSFSVEPPCRYLPWSFTTNNRTCALLAFIAPTTATNGARVDFRMVYNRVGGSPGQVLDDDGTTDGDTTIVQIRNNIASGEAYPCGASDGYWTRLNYILRLIDCPWNAPFDLAAGTYFNEATAGTFDGTGGNNGFTEGEPCNPAAGTAHRGKAGCFTAGTPVDGDFINMIPIDPSQPFSVSGSPGSETGNGPMLGAIDSTAGNQGASRDVDWYKFTLDVDSYVTLSIDSGGFFTSAIVENTCDFDNQDTHLVVGTMGRCGGRRLNAEGIAVLRAGTWIVQAFNSDPFAGSAGFTNILCGDPVSSYLVSLTAVPLPECTPATGSVATKEAAEGCPLQFFPDATCTPLNDGCVQDAWGADSISSGSTVRGTLFTTYLVPPVDIFVIDQDYYEFDVAVPSQLKLSGFANGPVRFQVLDTGINGANCDADFNETVRLMAQFDATSCDEMVASEGVTYLQPGRYSIVAAPGSVDQGLLGSVLDCNNSEQRTYTLSMTLTAVGCCATAGGDVVATASECSNLGGTFSAGVCANEYSIAAPRGSCGPLVSIAGSGVRVDGGNAPGASKAIGDEDVLVVPIGFPFSYYGESYTQVGISSNGFLVLGSDNNSPLARPFAADSQPNGVIAPFWSNWSAFGHTGADFGVWTQTSGGVGNGVFTVEWFVGLDYSTFAHRARFQVILYEATGNIEFRYGTFSELANAYDDEGETFSVGIEDKTGLRGLNVPVDGSFLANGNTCVLITPAVFVCCPGDANGDSAVDFNDITEILGNWLEGTQPSTPNNFGDANCDGDVNFNDITEVLGNWLESTTVCP